MRGLHSLCPPHSLFVCVTVQVSRTQPPLPCIDWTTTLIDALTLDVCMVAAQPRHGWYNEGLPCAHLSSNSSAKLWKTAATHRLSKRSWRRCLPSWRDCSSIFPDLYRDHSEETHIGSLLWYRHTRLYRPNYCCCLVCILMHIRQIDDSQ